MRLLVIALAALATWVAAGAAQASPAPSTGLIGCHENAQVSEPIRVDRKTYRVLFGKIALPSSRIVQEPTRSAEGDPFPYWVKMGFLLRIGSGPVDVRIPTAWRGRAVIGWGHANLHEAGLRVRFEGCPLPRVGTPWSQWIAFPGGVSVKRPACVPLIVSVGGRSERVELPIGRRCR